MSKDTKEYLKFSISVEHLSMVERTRRFRVWALKNHPCSKTVKNLTDDSNDINKYVSTTLGEENVTK